MPEPEAPEPTADDLAPREPTARDTISVGRSADQPDSIEIHFDMNGDGTEGGITLTLIEETARELKNQLHIALESPRPKT